MEKEYDAQTLTVGALPQTPGLPLIDYQKRNIKEVFNNDILPFSYNHCLVLWSLPSVAISPKQQLLLYFYYIYCQTIQCNIFTNY